MIINKDYRNGYFIQFFVVLLAAFISNRIRLRDFIHYYSNIVYTISILSLVVFVGVSIYPSIINIFPTINNYAGSVFANLFVSNVIINSNNILRNFCIFREPGVFIIYLLLGLIIELYYNGIIDYKRVFVYIVTIVTTFSTTGYILLAFLLLIFIVKNIRKRIVFWSTIGLLCLTIFLIPIEYSVVFAKFDTHNYAYLSAQSRISSVVIPFMIFVEHWYGIGLSNFVINYLEYSKIIFGRVISPEGDSTNTILNTFAIYGVFYGSILFYGLFKFAKSLCSQKIMAIPIFLILLLISSAEELRFSLLFNIIIMYGFLYVETSNISKNIPIV